MGGDYDNDPADPEDFYDRLLNLAGAPDLTLAVREALTLLIREAGAVLGYVELRSLNDGAVRFSVAQSSTGAEVSRDAISIGILDRVISKGEGYLGGAAAHDARASLFVVPIEVDIGALYFQAHHELDARIRRRIEHFAHCLQPLTIRLLGESSLEAETAAYERRRVLEALARHRWNISASADELDVKRQSMYPLLRRLGIGLR